MSTLFWLTVYINAVGKVLRVISRLSSAPPLCFLFGNFQTQCRAKTGRMGRLCFDSSNLFPGAVLSKYYPHILNSVAGDRFEGRQKQRLPVCKISKGQNNGKHLGVCWKWRGCCGDVIAETQPVEPQSRKITSRNNNNRKSNQVTYEM